MPAIVESKPAVQSPRLAADGRRSQFTPNVPAWKEPQFNPEIHLAAFEAPKSRTTFEDLGIPRPTTASSPIAGTSPFPLFSPAAIPIIRKSLLNPRYVGSTSAIFGSKTLILRNTAAHSPFFRRMWTDESVMRVLSEAAGVPLEPVMETMELGHANVQVDFNQYAHIKDEGEKLRKVAKDLTGGKFAMSGRVRNTVQERTPEEIKRAVDGAGSLLPWHYDSYPWVCVVMVSDTSSMTGGETVIQRGDGSYIGISQPGMGSAMMLQGGLVKHLALSSTSDDNDRITIITSYRAKTLSIYDSSFMSNIRAYSDLEALYHQWLSYRMDRLSPGLKRLEDRRRFVSVMDERDVREDMEERIVLMEYAKRTLRQMVPPEVVKRTLDNYGPHVFYTVRNDYVSGALFKGQPKPCPFCPGATIDKGHLTACPGGRRWRSDSPIWGDWAGTWAVIAKGDVEILKRMEELQVRDVTEKWAAEGRPWGIVDELAVQGLGEYIIEFLEMYGWTTFS